MRKDTTLGSAQFFVRPFRQPLSKLNKATVFLYPGRWKETRMMRIFVEKRKTIVSSRGAPRSSPRVEDPLCHDERIQAAARMQARLFRCGASAKFRSDVESRGGSGLLSWVVLLARRTHTCVPGSHPTATRSVNRHHASKRHLGSLQGPRCLCYCVYRCTCILAFRSHL